MLATFADEDLRRATPRNGWGVVSENVGTSTGSSPGAMGEHHAGVVFTSPRRFHQGSATHAANLVAALEVLLGDAPKHERDWTHWLS